MFYNYIAITQLYNLRHLQILSKTLIWTPSWRRLRRPGFDRRANAALSSACNTLKFRNDVSQH